MNTLKSYGIAVLVLFTVAGAPAFADADHGYRQLFIFGDSLSDPGNRFAVTGETAHPPFQAIPDAAYGIGGHHFSNGRTWIEVLAQNMELTEWAKPAYRDPAFGNYAYGGARGRNHSPTAPSFGQQVQAWIGVHGCSGVPMNDALFIVQFGGNDLRDALGSADPVAVGEETVTAIVTNIAILAGCGARNIAVANAPNLGAAPLVEPGLKPLVTWFSSEFNVGLNWALGQALTYLLPPDMNVTTIDFFGFVTSMTTGPNGLFADVTSSCLTFDVSTDAFCKDRDSYFFWDAIHPTKKAHAYLAEFAIGQLPTKN